jgi:hypothetical protein
MQASDRSDIRRSPFGDVLRRFGTRHSAIDVVDGLRTDHAEPRPSPYDIFSLRPALDGVSDPPALPLHAEIDARTGAAGPIEPLSSPPQSRDATSCARTG